MMKKTLFTLVILCICIVSCDDSGSSPTRAQIIAEEFVQDEMLSPDDLDFDVINVESLFADRYRVTANIKALNALEMKVPRKVVVDVEYKNGDWTEKNNWIKHSISYDDKIDTSTKTSNNNGWEVFNEAKNETVTIAGIKFVLLFNNQYTANLASKKKLTKAQVKSVIKDKNWKNKDLYFYVEGKSESIADCYADYIGGMLDYVEN